MRFNFRQPTRGMNKSEMRYASTYLDLLKKAGEILEWKFEPFNLRLADNTFYKPDFLVVYPDRLEIHEYKGHWEDDARVKFKVAAEHHWWFKFVAVQLIKGAWVFERY